MPSTQLPSVNVSRDQNGTFAERFMLYSLDFSMTTQPALAHLLRPRASTGGVAPGSLPQDLVQGESTEHSQVHIMTALQDLYPEDFSYCYGCGRLNSHGLHVKSEWLGDT